MDQPAPNEAASSAPVRAAPGWIGAAVDYGPLVAFFVAYEIGGLKASTITVIVATLIAVAVGWTFTRRFAFIPAMTAVVVGVLGGLTLYLNDPDFIKMKPTIVYLLFALLVAVELVSGRPLIVKAMTAAMPPVNDAGKRALLIRFLVFFVIMAAINEVVRRTVSTDLWVIWKVPGAIGATFLFALAQIPLVSRHRLPDPQA
jgi:intracellular septation protein